MTELCLPVVTEVLKGFGPMLARVLDLQPGGKKKKKKASGIGTWLPGHYSLLAPPINCLLEGQSRAEELILVEGGESLLFAVRYILDY